MTLIKSVIIVLDILLVIDINWKLVIDINIIDINWKLVIDINNKPPNENPPYAPGLGPISRDFVIWQMISLGNTSIVSKPLAKTVVSTYLN